MKIGTITAEFEIENFNTFQEWFKHYKKDVINMYEDTNFPDTADGRSMVNSIVAEINKTIKEKWHFFGCDLPEIKNVIVEGSVKL